MVSNDRTDSPIDATPAGGMPPGFAGGSHAPTQPAVLARMPYVGDQPASRSRPAAPVEAVAQGQVPNAQATATLVVDTLHALPTQIDTQPCPAPHFQPASGAFQAVPAPAEQPVAPPAAVPTPDAAVVSTPLPQAQPDAQLGGDLMTRLCRWHAVFAPFAGVIVAVALILSGGLLYWMVFSPVGEPPEYRDPIDSGTLGVYAPEWSHAPTEASPEAAEQSRIDAAQAPSADDGDTTRTSSVDRSDETALLVEYDAVNPEDSLLAPATEEGLSPDEVQLAAVESAAVEDYPLALDPSHPSEDTEEVLAQAEMPAVTELAVTAEPKSTVVYPKVVGPPPAEQLAMLPPVTTPETPPAPSAPPADTTQPLIRTAMLPARPGTMSNPRMTTRPTATTAAPRPVYYPSQGTTQPLFDRPGR